MNNELQTKNTNTSLSAPMDMGMENLLTEDIRIPQLLLINQMSSAVTDEKIQARAGEIRESWEMKVLGGTTKPVQIIPFYTTNTWTVRGDINGKTKTLARDPRNHRDLMRPYEETINVNGSPVTVQNNKTLNIFFLLKDSNLSVPYMVSLLRSNYFSAAQPFINKGAELRGKNEVYANYVFNVTSYLDDKNKKGKFYALKIEVAKDTEGKDLKTTPEEFSAAVSHYKMLSSMLNNNVTVNANDDIDSDSE